MAADVTYSHAREHFAELWDKLEESREMAVIRRRGHEDMALIPADELASLRETAYLLRSPANAARLLSALNSARRGKGKRVTLETLRAELGVEKKP
jgi:antitoxin YefM